MDEECIRDQGVGLYGRTSRRHAVPLSVVIGGSVASNAFAVTSSSLFNMGMVMAPLLILYLLSILLAIFPFQARRKRAAQTDS